MQSGYFGKTLTRAGRYRLLERIAESNAALTLDGAGTVTAANSLVEQLIGMPASSVVGKPFSKVFFPVDGAPSVTESLRKSNFAIRNSYVTAADKTRRYVVTRFYSLGDARGTSKVVVLCSDMTAAHEKEARQQKRFEAIDRSHALIEFDLDGNILDLNESFSRAMGYRRDELIGRPHRMFAPAEIMSEADYRKFWDDLRADRIQAGEFERKRRDGSSIFLQASYTPVHDDNGKTVGVVKVATDVSRLVEARRSSDKVAGQVDGKLESIVSVVAGANARSLSASTAASQTSDVVQHAADAVQDFEASSQRIAQAMTRSRDAVSNVNKEAQTADSHIAELSSAAHSMTSIVEIIQKVAGQINLLALNATIEAARAGEAGKGFAVVAAEVKSLADQVEKSTNQIGSDISRVQRVSGNVIEVLHGISNAVKLVEESVSIAGGAIEEQTAAARDITTGMQQAASSVREINDDLTEISSAVAQADTYARESSTMYKSLKSATMH